MPLWSGPEVPVITRPGLDKTCGLSSIAASPDGRAAAVSRSGGLASVGAPLGLSSVLVFGPDCTQDGANCRVHEIGSTAGIAYPSWSGRRSLFVIGANRRSWPSRVVEFDWNSNGDLTSRGVGNFTPISYRLAFSGIVNWTDASGAADHIEYATLPSVPKFRPLSGSWVQGRFVGNLVENLTDLSIGLQTSTQPIEAIELHATEVQRPVILAGDTRWQIGDAGYVVVGQEKWLAGDPLLEALSGRVVGLVEGRQIRGLTRSASWGKINLALAKYETSYIASASYVASHDVLFVLLKDVFGGAIVVRLSAGRVTTELTTSCRNDGRAPPKIAFDDWGAIDRPLPVQRMSAGPTRKLVVYFHGGPGGQGAKKPANDAIRVYLDAGYDVALVEYSGSRGSGLGISRRLASEQFDAVSKDVEEIGKRIGEFSTKYDEIALHGESYGAVYAATLQRSIFPSFTVLVAPWLQYRKPQDWLPNGQARWTYQEKFENRIFGWRSSSYKSAWLGNLAKSVESWPPGRETLVILGEADRLVPAAEVSRLLDPKRVRILVMPNINHEYVLGYDKTLAALEAYLAERAARSEPPTAPGSD